MTIGINLLREAREKFAAAVAAVKDELKNPDLAEEVKPAALELGDAFDEHLTDLAQAMGTDQPAADDPAAVDKGESNPNTQEPSIEGQPASTEEPAPAAE